MAGPGGGEVGQRGQSPQGPRNPGSPASPALPGAFGAQGLQPSGRPSWEGRVRGWGVPRGDREGSEGKAPCAGVPWARESPRGPPRPLQASACPAHPPHAASPPNLTTPSTHTSWGPGGEGRPQAAKGEGGQGSWLLPGAVGVKLLLLKMPNSRRCDSWKEGGLSAPVPSLLRRPPQAFGLLGTSCPGGARGSTEGMQATPFPGLPPLPFGDPCPSATLHSWPSSCPLAHWSARPATTRIPAGVPQARSRPPLPPPLSCPSGIGPASAAASIPPCSGRHPFSSPQAGGQRGAEFSVKGPGLPSKAWSCCGLATSRAPRPRF